VTCASRLLTGFLAIAFVASPGPLFPEPARAGELATVPAVSTATTSPGASPWVSLALPGLAQGLHGEPWTFALHLGGTAALTTSLWAAQNALFYRDSSFVPPEQQAAMVLQGLVLSWLLVGGFSVADAFRFGPATAPPASPRPSAPPSPPAGEVQRLDRPGARPRELPPVPFPLPEVRQEVPVVRPVESPATEASPPPVRRSGNAAGPEQRILEAYDLAARGRAWEAVKRVSRVTEPGWQPKVRALLAEWGPRAAAAGLSEANDALDSGLLEEFDAIAALLARLSLTADQARRLASLRRARPKF
jgi:hypothetical protein